MFYNNGNEYSLIGHDSSTSVATIGLPEAMYSNNFNENPPPSETSCVKNEL